MKRWRWLAWPLGSLGVALVAAWIAAPDPVAVEAAWLRDWQSTDERRLSWRLFALRDSSETYFAAWQLADTRERAAREVGAPIGLTIRTEANVPAAAGRRYREAIEEEWATLVPQARARVVVRLLIDTADAQPWRSVMIPVDTAKPCIVYIRIPRGLARGEAQRADVSPTAPAARSAAGRTSRTQQRLGACGLYGRYGYPGRGMREWLTRTQLRTAALHTSQPFEPPVDDRSLRRSSDRMFYMDALACSVGTLSACTDFLEGNPVLPMQWRPFRDDALAPPRRMTNAQRIAVYWDNYFDLTMQGRRLAQLRATIGDDRFAVLWRADAEPAREFQSREGAPLEELISTSLRSKTYRYVRGNGVRGLSLLVVLAVVALGAGLAVLFTKRVYRAPA